LFQGFLRVIFDVEVGIGDGGGEEEDKEVVVEEEVEEASEDELVDLGDQAAFAEDDTCAHGENRGYDVVQEDEDEGSQEREELLGKFGVVSEVTDEGYVLGEGFDRGEGGDKAHGEGEEEGDYYGEGIA